MNVPFFGNGKCAKCKECKHFSPFECRGIYCLASYPFDDPCKRCFQFDFDEKCDSGFLFEQKTLEPTLFKHLKK